jgi:acetoin utilization deacetylase AcuC-like enzyme
MSPPASIGETTRVRVVHSPAHLRHDPGFEVEHGLLVGHHELPVRAERVRATLAADDRFTIVPPEEWGTAPIDAVHDPGLARFLERAWRDFQRDIRPQREVFPDVFEHRELRAGMGEGPEPASVLGGLGRWCFEMATPLVEGTYGAARGAVDVALTATASVLDGDRRAFGNCRPPGHHAAHGVFGGFCYFNNAAVAAQHAVATRGTTVTVLDVDYHHGNGTQQIFYERGDVQYVSLHGDPTRAYPYLTGHADETGAGAGRGTTLNLPLPERTDDDAYLAALVRALDAIDAFDPGLVVLSLGVDTYHNDPISDLALTQDGYERFARAVAALGRPTVVLLEGGYDLDAVGENVRRWLGGLL